MTSPAGEDDDTVAIVRRPKEPASGSTPAIRVPDDQADGQADDLTVVVAKRAKTTSAAPTPLAPTPTPAPPRTARRRGIAPPPGPLGVAPQAIESAGKDATESYSPRAIPAPRPPRENLPDGAAATRDLSAALPSVARRSHITARAALVAFGLACGISVIGLTLIALAYLRAR